MAQTIRRSQAADLDEAVAALELFNYSEPHLLKRVQQERFSTVAESNLDEPRRRSLQNHVCEILIFGDQNRMPLRHVIPNLCVRPIPQSHIKHADRTHVELSLNEASQRRGQLVINEEVHADRKTE